MEDITIGIIPVQGWVRIELVDSESRKVEKTIERSNLVTNETLTRLLQEFPVIFANNINIAISTSNALPAFSATQVPNTIAIGFLPSNLNVNGVPTFIEDTDPIFGELVSVIELTGTERTFQTVLLTDEQSIISIDTNTRPSVRALAYTRIDNVVTQRATQFVRIFYQIKFPVSGYGVRGWVMKEIAKQIFGQFGRFNSYIAFYTLGCSAVQGTSVEHNLLMPTQRLSTNDTGFSAESDISRGQGATATRSINIINSHFKNKKVVNYSRRNLYSLGMIINSLYVGLAVDNRRAYYHEVNNEGKGTRYNPQDNTRPPEPRQVAFWHTGASISPFFESDFSPGVASRGRITWGGTWTRKLPVIFRVEITQTGAVGTAQYRFHVKRHTGFLEASYGSRAIEIPWRQTFVAPLVNVHGYQCVDVQKWDEIRLVQWDATGVTLLNLWDGTFQTWDSGTQYPLTATAICQVSADPERNLIWVACRSTGLWRINVTDNTCVKLQSLPCFGIDIAGNDGTAYAVLDGRIADSTSNFATALPFVHAPISDGGNWFKVKFIKGNRYSSDRHIAIVCEFNTGTQTVLWWQPSSSAVTVVDTTSQRLFHASTIGNCPATPTWWAMGIDNAQNGRRIAYLSFGSANVTTPLVTESNNTFYMSTPLYTNSIAFWKNTIVANTGFYTQAGGKVLGINNQSRINKSETMLHWDTGIFFLTDIDSKISSWFQAIEGVSLDRAWTSYGWDGTAWSIQSTASKTTHTDAQSLIEGLTISFANLTTGIVGLSYIQNEYLTQPYNYGLLKSNAENISLAWQYYTKNLNPVTNYSATIPTATPPALPTITLPVVNDIDFIRIETDSPDLNQFFIDGQPIARLRTDGAAPAINEITLNGTAGTLQFNSADIGKSVTGSYFWIGN